jgi:hypothetical protein
MARWVDLWGAASAESPANLAISARSARDHRRVWLRGKERWGSRGAARREFIAVQRTGEKSVLLTGDI